MFISIFSTHTKYTILNDLIRKIRFKLNFGESSGNTQTDNSYFIGTQRRQLLTVNLYISSLVDGGKYSIVSEADVSSCMPAVYLWDAKLVATD